MEFMNQQINPESTFRTAALARYPKATLCGEGPWAVILYDGRTHIEFFQTPEEARRFAGGGFRIEFFGERPAPREFKHRMDRERD